MNNYIMEISEKGKDTAKSKNMMKKHFTASTRGNNEKGYIEWGGREEDGKRKIAGK